MIRIGLLLSAIFAPSCFAATIHLLLTNTRTQNQTLIDRSRPSDTIVFPAGTLAYATSLHLKCNGGRIYTGSGAFPSLNRYPTAPAYSTSIVANTTTTNSSLDIESGASGTSPGTACTIENIYVATQGIYIPAESSGIQFSYIQCDGIKGYANPQPGACFYFDSDSAKGISYTNIEYSVFGNLSTLANCGGPKGGMAPGPDNTSCTFIRFAGELDHINIDHNRTVYGDEGIGIAGGPGAISALMNDVNIFSNDFQGIHRIAIENQCGTCSNINIHWNSFHDMVAPENFSFPISNACCTASWNPPSTGPVPITDDNVIVMNTPLYYPGNRYAYCIENAGTTPTVTNNLCQMQLTDIGITLSGSDNAAGLPFTTNPIITDNIVQGPTITGAIACAQSGHLPSSCSGVRGTYTIARNLQSSTVTPVRSVAPSLSPVSGTYSTLPVVTVSVPPDSLAFYTTDGTTPVLGSGTAQQYVAPFTCPSTCTVKAVAMWGGTVQPLIYPSGWGYLPSAVVSATYANSGPAAARTKR